MKLRRRRRALSSTGSLSPSTSALWSPSVIEWIQVVVASLRKRKVEVPDDKRLLYEVEADRESAVVGNRKLDHISGLSFLHWTKQPWLKAPTMGKTR
ncbi:hypothetical protein QN277_018321 [Acacia crassicarpa]|uniref:Uncharacterized protein n=1 Tax=Acacia crassicarpa TaxID=499986 RepID=A0AAE1KJ86_9FABA|nr:hypothetical protein QN277_018321 [Acacia crassicarpa]